MRNDISVIVDLFANGIKRFVEIVEFIEQREKSADFENTADMVTDTDHGNEAFGIAQGLDRIKDGTQAFARDLSQQRKLEHHVDHAVIHRRTQQLFKLCGDWLTDITGGANDQYLIADFGMNGHGYKYGIVFEYCSSAELKISNCTK